MFGKILGIDNNYVTVENISNSSEVNYIGFHVVFLEKERNTVGEIVAINPDIIKIFLVGEIRNGVFYSGIMKKPSFNSKLRIIYKNELELLLGSQDIGRSDNLYIGTSTTYDGFKICANLNDFFSNHFAIIGNTGSGKSCGVARILQNLFYHNDDMLPLNAHMALFDVYGEYNTAFKDISRLPGLNYQYYTSDTSIGSGSIINIPAYLLEVDDLALLLHANNANQIPIIEKALQFVYVFKNDSAMVNVYKNKILANSLLEILSSGRNSTQIRDQIVAVLTRYNTKEISTEAPIYQPGYTRTLSQCLIIDNQGKMSSVQLVVDYLEKLSKVKIDNLSINKNVVYSLEDLYYALDFALISEGMLKSEKVYDSYNQLLTRLGQIMNSDYKKFFEVGEKRISRKHFVERLFGDSQIINFNLNYIDHRLAKTLTKIYSKLMFDFTTNNEDRGSYPIHIVLEEAHRYVQNDNDLEIIGYNIFDRITKEGRKYGTILGMITQRVSELSSTAISQCSNFIVFRMFHPDDLNIISNISTSLNEEAINKLKSIVPGTAMVFGTAFKLPLLTKLELPDPMPLSTSVDVVNVWYSDRISVRFENEGNMDDEEDLTSVWNI